MFRSNIIVFLCLSLPHFFFLLSQFSFVIASYMHSMIAIICVYISKQKTKKKQKRNQQPTAHFISFVHCLALYCIEANFLGSILLQWQKKIKYPFNEFFMLYMNNNNNKIHKPRQKFKYAHYIGRCCVYCVSIAHGSTFFYILSVCILSSFRPIFIFVVFFHLYIVCIHSQTETQFSFGKKNSVEFELKQILKSCLILDIDNIFK